MTEKKMVVRCYRSPQESRDEIMRELNVRSRCFPRWIEDGRVSATDAQDRLDRLATAFLMLEMLDSAPQTCTVADFHIELAAKLGELNRVTTVKAETAPAS